jgi:peptidoglycan/xylan/chitin deacetylase (PgdA/CDA1 family)
MNAGRLASLVLALGALTGPSATGQPASRTVALTFDDLPYVAVSTAYLPAAQRATRDLLGVLAKHRAPALGFVNEIQLEGPDRDARIALLQQWVDRGMLLGNHTYSHPDFNTISIEQFQEEILKGEVVTRRLLASRPSSRLFFRHPMTHTGDTKEKKEAIEKFLTARGYTIAPHTIENSDFVFNRVYARALAKNDHALAGKVRAEYLDFTIDVTAFAESASPKIFGREIAQTLLLHANDLNADCLDELLTRYEARGYRFVTLEQAMADPAYSTPDTMVSAYGPTWLWRWRTSLGMKVSFAGDPEVPAWVTELFNRSFPGGPNPHGRHF